MRENTCFRPCLFHVCLSVLFLGSCNINEAADNQLQQLQLVRDQTTFNALLGNTTVIDFEGIATHGGQAGTVNLNGDEFEGIFLSRGPSADGLFVGIPDPSIPGAWANFVAADHFPTSGIAVFAPQNAPMPGDPSPTGSLIVDFDAPTSGVGGYFLDVESNPSSLEAFDGPGGTGNSLGRIVLQNEGDNSQSFAGIIADNIQSAVFAMSSHGSPDGTGLDDLTFGTISPLDDDGDGVAADVDCDDANRNIGALLYENDFSVDDGWFSPTPQRPGPWGWDSGATYAQDGGQEVQIGTAQSWENVVVYATVSSRGTETDCGISSWQQPCSSSDRWRAGILARAALDADQDEGFHGYRCALASNAANGCYEDGLFLQLSEFMDAPEDDARSECDSSCPPNTTFDQLGRQNHEEINLATGDTGHLTFYAVGNAMHCEARGDHGETVSVSASDDSFSAGTVGLSTLNMFGEFSYIKVCQAFTIPGEPAEPCDENLVSNGSFESPVIDRFYWKISDGQTIGAWTVGRTSVDIVSETYHPSYVAHDGTQTIDMAGTPGPGSIYQDVSTVSGNEYQLRFALSSNGGAKSNSVTVHWDGVELGTLSSPTIGSWELHSYTLTAQSTSTRLEFIGNYGGSAGALLDSVELTPLTGCAAGD